MADLTAKTGDKLADEMLKNQLIKEGMDPNTPLNMPKHAVWVQDKDGWKLYSGRDSEKGFNRFGYPGYKNALLTKNGQTPEERFKEMDDYDLFKSIHYSPSDYGRPNYAEGEQEEMWNDLSKYFDLPKYEPNKYGFTDNSKDRTIGLITNGVQDGRGFGGWKVKPQNLGTLKRK